MRRLFPLALAAAFSALPLSATQAADNAWLFLGARNVASLTDHETVGVDSERHFRQLQVCVFNTALQLNTIIVHFEGQQKQDVPVQARIGGGSCTHSIDLVNAPRRVHSVELTYKSVSRFRRLPMVRIVGR